MNAEHKDGGASKQSRRRAVTSTIRRSLKGEWQALSTSSSPRTSLSLDGDAVPIDSNRGTQSPAHSQAEGPHQRSGWHRKHRLHKTEPVRGLADILMATQPSVSGNSTPGAKAHEHEHKSTTSWGLGWSGRTRRFDAKRMLRKISGGSEDDRATHHHRHHHSLMRAAKAAEYPQSDDPTTGYSARERKRKIDAVYKKMVRMARELGTEEITRMEAAGFLPLSRWDVDAALRQLHIVLCTRDGILYEINPQIQMCGAVNSGGTSCYIDSLFMALFGAQASYDALLYLRDLRSEPANKLLAISRLYVNFMRVGELIDVWLVEEMRSALFACGWLGGASPIATTRLAQQQQDTSELYLFLMDALHMPYLPLEMRMVHGADHDAADCKMVTQRMVELSFPESSSSSSSAEGGDEDQPLLLQALLESYFFDNRVEQLERSLRSSPAEPGAGKPTSTKVRTNAWSFLSIYPFYTPQSEFDSYGPDSAGSSGYPDDAPFILPLLIKRYAVDERGAVRRVNRRVIIPMVLDVTNIISTGDESRHADDGKPGGASESNAPPVFRAQGADAAGAGQAVPPPYPSRVQYRLVLRSAVCHKGADVRAGHYISFNTRLRLARPAEIARRRLRGEQETATAENRDVGGAHAQSSGSARQRPGQLAMSLSNIGTIGITRWQTFAHTLPAAVEGGAAMTTPVDAGDVEIRQHSTQTASRRVVQRRHSWPLFSGEDIAEQQLDALLHDGSSGSSTPAASLYESQIHGSAADWENYAMTINLDEQEKHKKEQEQEQERLRNMSAEINNEEVFHGGAHALSKQPPPPYLLEEETCAAQRLCCDSGVAECATTGELLRFDDMDVAHGRVQHFSTGEGGRQCLDEISRDGYLLFYALQRVEMSDREDSSKLESETLSDKEDDGEENPSQAMAELSSALRRNERDEHARRVIAALMGYSGATDSSRQGFKSDSGDFEDMAMRWQNIRVNRLASPVGPLPGGGKKRWPDHHKSRKSSVLQRESQQQPVSHTEEVEEATLTRPPLDARATDEPKRLPLAGNNDTAVAAAAKADTKTVHNRHSNTTSTDSWCILM
ncbi:hypothetical protein EV178_000535 [Coemansia sp. RSA 1646]|nr:hypothetical protein EV178_000535 [Coemansia sp. RSA 1646]KAJ2093660.1 hypothetical protein IW138_000054 [Coemansia sp. RSA 986]